MNGAPSRADLALNRPVQVSSTDYAPTPADFVVDGVSAVGSPNGTGWRAAAGDPQWISVDLQAACRVERIGLIFEATRDTPPFVPPASGDPRASTMGDEILSSCAVAYTVAVSTDGTSWQDVSSSANGAGGVVQIPLPQPVMARWVRLTDVYEYPNHRHLSSLYPLFVSYELAPDSTPALWHAAATAYQKKIATYQGTESHYRMQASLCAARLGRGNDLWNFLDLMAANEVFHTSLVPSHYDHLNVFNVDASGGIPSVINNSLIFSLPGRLDLLPALPDALAVGGISGISSILARGQVTVDELTWDMPAGTVTARLSSAVTQKVSIGLPPGVSNAKAAVNGRAQQILDLGAGRRGCQVTLQRGRTAITASFGPVIPPKLLSQDCMVTASSTRTQDGNVVPANVVDGDLTTRWTSDYADNQWIMIDLGAAHQITDVKLDWETAAGKDYDIAVSTDGQTWTTVASVTGNTQAGWLDYPGLAAQGRYVRLDCLTRLTSYGFSLWEFQVFGQ